MNHLREYGSLAVEGYRNPEGVVVYYPKTKYLYKVTFDTPEGKWKESVDQS